MKAKARKANTQEDIFTIEDIRNENDVSDMLTILKILGYKVGENANEVYTDLKEFGDARSGDVEFFRLNENGERISESLTGK